MRALGQPPRAPPTRKCRGGGPKDPPDSPRHLGVEVGSPMGPETRGGLSLSTTSRWLASEKKNRVPNSLRDPLAPLSPGPFLFSPLARASNIYLHRGLSDHRKASEESHVQLASLRCALKKGGGGLPTRRTLLLGGAPTRCCPLPAVNTPARRDPSPARGKQRRPSDARICGSDDQQGCVYHPYPLEHRQTYPDPCRRGKFAPDDYMRIHQRLRTPPRFYTRGKTHPCWSDIRVGNKSVVLIRPYPCPCIRLFIRGGMQTPVAGHISL